MIFKMPFTKELTWKSLSMNFIAKMLAYLLHRAGWFYLKIWFYFAQCWSFLKFTNFEWSQMSIPPQTYHLFWQGIASLEHSKLHNNALSILSTASLLHH